MVLNHMLLIVLLPHSLLILVLTENSNRGFLHAGCSPRIRYDPVYLPHPTDCRKFYECDLGLAYEFRCPTDMHFNVYTNGCDTPENAFCRNAFKHSQKGASEYPKTRTSPTGPPVTTELRDMSTTKTSLVTQTPQTSQENNSVNRISTPGQVLRLSNHSNQISHHIKIASRSSVGCSSTSNSTKDAWSKPTKPPTVKGNTIKNNLFNIKFHLPSAGNHFSTEQQTMKSWTKRQNLITSTRPRGKTILRTAGSIASRNHKKISLRLKNKSTALESERTTSSISRSEIGNLKNIVFFGSITNNETVGENSILNKLPVNRRKDWTKVTIPVKWKKQ